MTERERLDDREREEGSVLMKERGRRDGRFDGSEGGGGGFVKEREGESHVTTRISPPLFFTNC